MTLSEESSLSASMFIFILFALIKHSQLFSQKQVSIDLKHLANNVELIKFSS